MTNIISHWIEERLGLVIPKFGTDFAQITKDGFLLCRLLTSYGIITKNDLAFIQNPETQEKVYNNFHLIAHWLQQINVGLSEDEIVEIINATETTSLNLFYKVFLALQNKTETDITVQQVLNEITPFKKSSKFVVEKVKDDPQVSECNFTSKFENNFDVIHWHRDRLEMLKNKCKLSREEYVNIIKLREHRKSSISFKLEPNASSSSKNEKDDKCSVESLDLSFEQLMLEKKLAKVSKISEPNPAECKTIMKNIRNKHKTRETSAILKRELHKKILRRLWEEIKDEEKKNADDNLVEKLLNQSFYEKQMLRKVEEVKLHKQTIMESKQILANKITDEQVTLIQGKIFGVDSDVKSDEIQYYLEKERCLQLHRKIYEKKMQVRHERCYKMCSEIVKQICDYAMKHSDYTAYYNEPPNKYTVNSWKQMFMAGVSFEHPDINPTSIVQIPECEEVESIIHLEIERQNKIDKQEFIDYIEFEPPWQLNTPDINENCVHELKCALNILGYIVQNILDAKYPLQPKPPMPNLPIMETAVCISGLYDVSCIPSLRILLKPKHYEIFEMQDVIHFCISAYKNEIREDVVESTDPAEVNSPAPKTIKKGLKTKSKLLDQKNQEPDVDDKLTNEIMSKNVQTPKYFPGEEMILSHEAQLGKVAEEELANGQQLTDFLLVSMFIEYLKSKTNIKGWILVNFPTTIQQTILLEEALSGKRFCDSIDVNEENMSDILEEEVINNSQKQDQFQEFRKSRILKFPSKPRETNKQISVLTAFIKLTNIQGTDEISSGGTVETNSPISNVEDFYIKQGCFYNFDFVTFNSEEIKNLAKLIIGNCDVPPIPSVELFGDSLKLFYANFGIKILTDPDTEKSTRKSDKLKKSPSKRISKVESKILEVSSSRNVKKNTEKSFNIEIIDKFTQIPDFESDMSEEKEEDVTEILVNPGEPGWPYVQMLPPDDLQIVLATFWETIEETYVVDFSQVLFLKRTKMNDCMPFIKFVKDYIDTFLKQPNNKQVLIREFQNVYNIFDEDIRNDDEFKAEYYCRIKTLKVSLIDICDKTLLNLEQEVNEIISKGWIPRFLIELTNIYINAFQLELNRFVDTLNLVNDYYTGIITKFSLEEMIPKEILPKIHLEDPTLAKEVNKYLKNCKGEIVINPFCSKIDEILNKCKMFVHKISQNTLAAHGKQHNVLTDKRHKSNSAKNPKSWLSVHSDPEINSNLDNLTEEWIWSIKGEAARVLICLTLLKRDFNTNVTETFKIFRTTFQDINTKIRSRYEKEIKSVENLCDLCTRAVEAEFPIEEELVIKGEEFFVDFFNKVYSKIGKEEKPAAQVDQFAFTITQLNKMCHILFDLGPSGFIAERSIVFIFQDLLAKNDNQYMKRVPTIWSELSPTDVNLLSLEFFGDVEYVPWKEFITRNLLLPYPNIIELLELRKQFRDYDKNLTETISYEDYCNIQFWFDISDSDTDASKIDEIRELIFKLYRCQYNSFNYTAMLLDFCKGYTISEGFAKAIAVSTGMNVCWNEEIGKKFIEDSRQNRRLVEEKVKHRNEATKQCLEDVIEILDNVVSKAVHLCESLVIEEIPVEQIKTTKRKNGNKKNNSVQNSISELNVKQNLKLDLKTDNSFTKNKHQLKVKYFDPKQILNVDSNVTFSLETLEDGKTLKPEPMRISEEDENTLYPLQYYVELDVIKDILNVVFCNVSMKNIEDRSLFEIAEDIFKGSKNPEFNGEVLAHEFLNNPAYLDLIKRTPKFIIKNPIDIVKNIVKLKDK